MADKIDAYLKANGFSLHRQGKHLIYSNGVRSLSVSRSPSDWRHESNVIRDIKRVVHASQREFVDPYAMPEKKEKPVTQQFNTPRVQVEQPKVKLFDQHAKDLMLAGRAEGKKTPEIAQVLAALGYTDKEGKPVHFRHVNVALATIEWTTNPKPKKAPEPAPKKDKAHAAPTKKDRSKFIHDVAEIITSNLSEDMKEKFIVQTVKDYAK